MSWKTAERRVENIKSTTHKIIDRAIDQKNLREVLRADLRENEEDAFADMLYQLEQSSTATLTTKQREWVRAVAEREHADYDDALDGEEYENLVSSGKVKANPNAPKFPFETMARPLKPPGRK